MRETATARATRRLIALDIDGTVMAPDGSISAPVRDSIAAARSTGDEVVIATGRCVLGAFAALDALGLDEGWAVCSNGAVTVRLDPAARQRFVVDRVERFEAAPVIRALSVGIPTARIAIEDLGRGFFVSAPFPAGEIAGTMTVLGPDALAAVPAHRLSVRGEDIDRDAFAHAVAALGLPALSYAVGYSAWIDVTGPGVTKASALERLRDRLGIAPANTVAVGDSDNDVDMLRWAGWGVAMGGGSAAALAAADTVTDTVAADGVAHVLHQLLV